MPFEDLRGFLMVAQHGSFLSAAVAMGIPRTTLRRQVEALEARTGVTLFLRRGNGVVLTEAGKQLAKNGRVLDEQFELLVRSVRDAGERPEGELRCLLPVGLPPPLIAAVYRIFNSNWPGILVRSELAVAPLETNFSDRDVVVWFGRNSPGRAWMSRTILPIPMRLFASKAYLDENGRPGCAADLKAHNLLAWVPAGESEPIFQLANGARRRLVPNFISPDIDLLHECVRMDLGIAWAPDARLPQPNGAPLFEGVLEEIFSGLTELRIAVPRAMVTVPKVRVFLEAFDIIRAAVLPMLAI